MKTSDLIEKTEDALKSCLQRVPFLEVESIRREARLQDAGIDIMVTVQVAGKQQRLIVEVKNNGQPREARMSAYQLARYRQTSPDVYGVFAAPYISPQAAAICSKEGVGCLDLAGNCRLMFDNVYINQEGKPNPFTEKRDLRSLYSPRASRVLRVLLNDPKRPWRVVALADEARVSLGLVSNVKSLLGGREWLTYTEDGFRLSDPEQLLAEWSESYSIRKNKSYGYYSLKNIAEIETELAQACERKGIAYALTGFSGSARYAPSVRYQRVMAYVASGLEDVANELGFKEVTSGQNVTMLIPYDKCLLYGSRTVDGISIVSPVQVYLDLIGQKGRGEEAATTLLDEVIRQTW